MKKLSSTKSYDNFMKFLTRKKLEKAGIISSLLLYVYTKAKRPTDYQQIKSEVVRQKGIFPCKSYKNYSDWREAMIKNGILICMASYKEMLEKDTLHKASLFKFGPAIKKYIEGALAEQKSLYERIDEKLDVVEYLDDMRRMNERIDLSATKEELADVKLELLDMRDNYEKLFLKFMPPDTPNRRKIVYQYRYDHDKCIQELNEENEFHN